METHYKSGIDWWQSYMWIGGPGAGGKVGAEGEGAALVSLFSLSVPDFP